MLILSTVRKTADPAVKIAVKLAARSAAKLVAVSAVPRPSYLFAPVSGVAIPLIGLGDCYAYAAKNAKKGIDEVTYLAKGRVLQRVATFLKVSSSAV